MSESVADAPNPFPEIAQVKTIEGMFEGVLRDIVIRDFKDWNNPELMNKGFIFVFDIPSEGTVASKVVARASLNEKSNCYKFVRSMAGRGGWREAYAADRETFWQLIKSFVGKKFTVSIVPSENGKYNNVEHISPVKKGEPMPAQVPDDDIPF